MGHVDKITYHLPLSCVRVAATITETVDDFQAGEPPERKPEATVTLEEVADATSLAATMTSGWLRDTSVAFRLSDDGRLVSSSVDSTGTLGKVLIGAITVASAAAGVIAARTPVSVLDTVAAPLSTEERVRQAYEKRFSDLVSLREHYVQQAGALDKLTAAAVGSLATAGDAGERKDALRKIQAYRGGSEIARAEIERLAAHFKTWRATTLKSRTEHRECLLSLDKIRRVAVSQGANGPEFAAVPAPAPDAQGEAAEGEAATAQKARDDARRIWDEYGVYVTVDGGATAAEPLPAIIDDEILVRIPRRVTLSLFKRGDGGAPELVDSRPHLVMDDACEVVAIQFRKSLWAKRSEAVEFSPNGALVGISTTRASAAAAISDAAQGMPGAVSAGLEQSRKIWDGVQSVRSAGIDQQLADLKRRIELKQSEIAEAGLLATEGSAAELARLQQQASILEQRKTIAGDAGLSESVASQIAALRQQLDLLTVQQELNKATGALGVGSNH
jgi:hypothetical protein